ncbi:hypothetical protein FJTKL_15422 [Diaporthe vaccinii]|uniref:Uncharacterized protein n=1 Tax=Diaporthe vaccinii TaxID=105482 RepID=A0ABR4E4Z2_9PEZI
MLSKQPCQRVNFSPPLLHSAERRASFLLASQRHLHPHEVYPSKFCYHGEDAHLLRLHEFQGEDRRPQLTVLIASSSGDISR